MRDRVSHPMNAAAIAVREVTDPHDPAIDAFGRMQTAAYFAPETLIPARYIPQLLDDQSSPRRNFLLVAEDDGRVVGGTLFHWLAPPGIGFSSFMGVDRALRGRGIARRMHERRFELLDVAAGGSGRAPGVFIDVVNPGRLAATDLARERAAGSDPYQRREVFAHLGFRQVDIRYEQPVGGPNGGPVTVLDLLFCPRRPSDAIATDLVVSTMRAYWAPWLGASLAQHTATLRARAGGKSELPLISAVPPRPAGPQAEGE